MRRNAAESATCIMEKKTKRLEMRFQQMKASGMLSASMPRSVEMRTPKSAVMRSMSTAMPVKPLGSRFAGFTNAWMRKACSSADATTAPAGMMRRTRVSRASSRARSLSDPGAVVMVASFAGAGV